MPINFSEMAPAVARFLARRKEIGRGVASEYSPEQIARFNDYLERYAKYKKDVRAWDHNERMYQDYRNYSLLHTNEENDLFDKAREMEYLYYKPMDAIPLRQKAEKLHAGKVRRIHKVDTDLYDVGEPRVPFFVENPKPSNQDNITRFHTTDFENVLPILNEGIKPRMGGGFQDQINNPSDNYMKQYGVFTTSRAPYHVNFLGHGLETYYPVTDNLVTLRMDIPKNVYRELPRADVNNEVGKTYYWDSRYGRHNFNNSSKRMLAAIPGGGRTDIFETTIDPSYISELCSYNDDCLPIKEWLEKYIPEKYYPARFNEEP